MMGIWTINTYVCIYGVGHIHLHLRLITKIDAEIPMSPAQGQHTYSRHSEVSMWDYLFVVSKYRVQLDTSVRICTAAPYANLHWLLMERCICQFFVFEWPSPDSFLEKSMDVWGFSNYWIKCAILDNYTNQIYSGITRGRLLSGELYTQRL